MAPRALSSAARLAIADTCSSRNNQLYCSHRSTANGTSVATRPARRRCWRRNAPMRFMSPPRPGSYGLGAPCLQLVDIGDIFLPSGARLLHAGALQFRHLASPRVLAPEFTATAGAGTTPPIRRLEGRRHA